MKPAIRSALLILLTLAPALAQPKDGLFLTGRVVDKNGVPVTGAAVSPDPNSVQAGIRALTGTSGQFRLGGLVEGFQPIEVERPGFLRGLAYYKLSRDKADSQKAVIERGYGSKLTYEESAEIVLVREAVVSGRLTNSEGEPIRGMDVQLLQKRAGEAKPTLSGSGKSRTTNADGRFSIGALEAGAYYLLASEAPLAARTGAEFDPRALLHRHYPATYFPGVITASDAKPLVLAEGENVTLEAMTLSKVPMSLVMVTLVDASGTVGYAPLDYALDGSMVDPSVTHGRISHQANGPFLLPPQPPGRIQLVATHGTASILQTVDVEDRDLHVTVTIPPPSTVNGTVRSRSGVASVTLSLQSRQILYPPKPIELKVDENGSFTVKDVGSGPFSLTITGRKNPEDGPYAPAPPHNAYVRSLEVNGQDVAGKAFTLTPETTMKIELAPAAIAQGSVVHARGELVRNTVVAVWRREVVPESAEPYFVRTAAADLLGGYKLQGLPPGEYRILAFQMAPPGKQLDTFYGDVLQDFEFREKFAQRAATIVTVEGGVVRPDLAYIPFDEIQPWVRENYHR